MYSNCGRLDGRGAPSFCATRASRLHAPPVKRTIRRNARSGQCQFASGISCWRAFHACPPRICSGWKRPDKAAKRQCSQHEYIAAYLEISLGFKQNRNATIRAEQLTWHYLHSRKFFLNTAQIGVATRSKIYRGQFWQHPARDAA